MCLSCSLSDSCQNLLHLVYAYHKFWVQILQMLRLLIYSIRLCFCLLYFADKILVRNINQKLKRAFNPDVLKEWLNFLHFLLQWWKNLRICSEIKTRILRCTSQSVTVQDKKSFSKLIKTKLQQKQICKRWLLTWRTKFMNKLSNSGFLGLKSKSKPGINT